MTQLVDRFPCPICGGRPELMAGINVPRGIEDRRYLVCWKDGLAAAGFQNGKALWTHKFRPDRPKKRKKGKSVNAGL